MGAPVTLLAVLALLFGTHANPLHAVAIERAAATHHADLALVSAVCHAESSSGVHGRILCGAMLHLPQSACADDPQHVAAVERARRAHRRRPPCLNRDPDAQAGYTARLFGGVARRHWPRMLAGYVCGPNPACQATTGAAYARRVLALRGQIHAALRRPR